MKPPVVVAGPEWATLVVKNGRVLTMDPARPQASAVAAFGGRIVAVGSDGDVDALVRPGVTQVHDAGGRVVAPGFLDIHAHLEWGGSTGPEVFVRQGVTTVVTGNCGISAGDVGAYLEKSTPREPSAASPRTSAPMPCVARSVSSTGTHRSRPPSSDVSRSSSDGLSRPAPSGSRWGPMYSPGMSFEEQLVLARPAASHGAHVASHVRHSALAPPRQCASSSTSDEARLRRPGLPRGKHRRLCHRGDARRHRTRQRRGS